MLLSWLMETSEACEKTSIIHNSTNWHRKGQNRVNENENLLMRFINIKHFLCFLNLKKHVFLRFVF